MRAVRIGIAVLLTASLAACGGDSDDSGPGPSSDAQPTSGASTAGPSSASEAPAPVAGSAPLPEAGQCWNLSTEELDEGMALISTASTALDCSGEHNAITASVVGLTEDQATQLEATVTAGTTVDPEHLEAWRSVVAPACQPAYDAAFESAAVPLDQPGIAAAYKASTLRGYGWLPSSDDWQAGARWIRCDIANQNGAAISFQQPSFDLQSIPAELVDCMNVNVEGTFPVPCDDPLANGQALVTVELDETATSEATADYAGFNAKAATICTDAVAAAFSDAGKPGLAALPIEFAFAGQFDCYVERAAGEPLIT